MLVLKAPKPYKTYVFLVLWVWGSVYKRNASQRRAAAWSGEVGMLAKPPKPKTIQWLSRPEIEENLIVRNLEYEKSLALQSPKTKKHSLF